MKHTSEIVISIFASGDSDAIARKAVKLLRNSAIACEYEIRDLRDPPNPDFVNNEEVVDSPEAKYRNITESIHAVAEEIASTSIPPTLYIMTSGASVFYGFEPYDGRLDRMTRITVSAMHPHYSNPLEVAQQLEDCFKRVGCHVVRSTYVEPKA